MEFSISLDRSEVSGRSSLTEINSSESAAFRKDLIPGTCSRESFSQIKSLGLAFPHPIFPASLSKSDMLLIRLTRSDDRPLFWISSPMASCLSRILSGSNRGRMIQPLKSRAPIGVLVRLSRE